MRGEFAVEGTGTRAHVVYSLRGTIPAVSDSVLNEARVGFLSHPKTMCRCLHGVVSLLLVRLWLGFSLRLPSHPLLLWPPAFTGFLHQISYTHDLGGAGLFCGPGVRANPRGGPYRKKDEGRRREPSSVSPRRK